MPRQPRRKEPDEETVTPVPRAGKVRSIVQGEDWMRIKREAETPVPTPALDHMLTVRDKAQVLDEFFDWMRSTDKYGVGVEIRWWDVECPRCYGGGSEDDFGGSRPTRRCYACRGDGTLRVDLDGHGLLAQATGHRPIINEYVGYDERAAENERQALLTQIRAQAELRDLQKKGQTSP